MLARIKAWAKHLKAEVYALWLAYQHPRTPLLAKLVALFVVCYAFSPIDLIPDFIPVLGYLDDAIIVPIGIYVALRLIPSDVMLECRQRAKRDLEDAGSKSKLAKPKARYVAMVLIILLYAAGAWWSMRLMYAWWWPHQSTAASSPLA